MGYGADGAGLPESIGGYAVERELGAGGMGVVYLARSRGGRAVAVKVARSELATDPHFRERFRAEVEAARSVGGFHTAQVVDADPAAAAPWLATAYIPGPTLSALVEAEGPMGEARLRQLGAALAEALAAIHRCGLVHRDLKPGNIIMASDGPRVLDFGIARALESTRLTATGMAFGTPGFLAPEQAQGQQVGGAADVFALGAVLVAAAGGSAFGAGTPMGLMYRSVHEAPNLAAVPDGLRTILASCLAKEPAQRPTPDALLDLFVPGGAAHAPMEPPTPPLPSYAPHHGAPEQWHQAPADGAPAVAPGFGPGFAPAFSPTAPAVSGTDSDVAFIAVASDGHILIDAVGVEFGTRSGDVQFTWAQISTVEYAAWGPKHLSVTVRFHNGTAYPCVIAARTRARLREWLEDLPLILEYFG
ncbi:serine/threonine protein kinase [Streptomyces sp. NBC_00876]|uniref:serine/threonine-protein kinase n=1 Tax=Streptomyces sp. NBC_00876 TaxID=2975853 RepID=UPI0038655DAE|nr:serine/threonine protein kinase [Streptomyces sp. NBC_00876]